jgi:hypothetical protein
LLSLPLNHYVLKRITSFRESDINFRFDENWLVYRFDKHRYYRGFSGAGLKGVDFLAIHQDTQLVLMEIKNYNPRGPWKRGTTLEDILANPEVLSVHFSEKITDTLLAIDAIRQYWQRRWWRRLLWRIFSYLQPAIHEYAFWQRVCTLAQDPKSCIAVLWLESNELGLPVRDQLQQGLALSLQTYCSSVVVCDIRNQPFATSVQADR